MKIDIPEEQFNRFQQTVADSTFWNEAELNPRQIKHITACLAPEVAEWALAPVYEYLNQCRMLRTEPTTAGLRNALESVSTSVSTS